MSAEMGIYDIAGKKINGKMHIQDNTSSFDLSGYPNGIYFVELKSVKEMHRLKVVKY